MTTTANEAALDHTYMRGQSHHHGDEEGQMKKYTSFGRRPVSDGRIRAVQKVPGLVVEQAFYLIVCADLQGFADVSIALCTRITEA